MDQRSLSPQTLAAQESVSRLLSGWDDAAADRLFCENVALDQPYQERLANLATKAAVEGEGAYRIHAPLIKLTKGDIIRLGASLGVDYGLWFL